MRAESPGNGLIDEDARRHFEHAWRDGAPEPIERCLPPKEHPSYLATLQELVCIDLEFRWTVRQPPASDGTVRLPPLVESYLERFPCLREAPVLRRLIQQEHAVRQRAGERPGPEEYRRRFPTFTGDDVFLDTMPSEARPAGLEHDGLPGFDILAPIARGGMGVVLKARQHGLNRVVAIKRMLAGAQATPEELSRFHREAEAVARLQHQNIVQIYEIGAHAGLPFFSLEYVEGGNLAQRIGGAPQPPGWAAQLVLVLTRAVEYAHGRGVLHRDLKPANVLLTAEGVPKLTDFGLARHLGVEASPTATGEVLGTPSYMAPEQAAGQLEQLGPATDVYALGAILYELLTGRPPFHGETALETLEQVRSMEVVPPRRLQPKTPRDLETISLKCLEKEPRQRYASARALAEDLERFLGDRPIQARPAGMGRRCWKWSRRHPLASLAALAALALAVAVAGGGFLWQRVEFQSKQQAFQYLTEHLSDARASEELALAELRADRAQSAQQILAQAVARLDDPRLTEVRDRLHARQVRVGRLVEFYRLADRAERQLFFEREEAAIAAAEAALDQLNVPTNAENWSERLPAVELSPDQRVRLRADVRRTLLLLTAMRLRQGLLTLDPAAKHAAYRRTLEDLRLVEATPPLHSVRLLELLCRYGLGERPLQKLPAPEPHQPPDAYFFGIAYMQLAALNDLIRLAMPAELRDLSGLDFANPREESERMLRAAASQQPFHYWTHVWLGWCVSSGHDYRGAETAFNTCVALRPNGAMGHPNRALVLFAQAGAVEPTRRRWHELHRALEHADASLALTPGGAASTPFAAPVASVSLWAQSRTDSLAAQQQALHRRGVGDLDLAVAHNAHDPLVQWIRYHCLAASGRPAAAMESCIKYVELEVPLAGWRGRRPFLEKRAGLEKIRNFAQQQIPALPDPRAAWGALALANLALGQEQEALLAAEQALSVWADHEQALVVRGQVHLNAQRTTEALADFEATLRIAQTSFRAAVGAAEAQEALGMDQLALLGFHQAFKIAVTDWQQIAALRGQARVHQRLGNTVEARQALETARQLDPALADAK